MIQVSIKMLIFIFVQNMYIYIISMSFSTSDFDGYRPFSLRISYCITKILILHYSVFVAADEKEVEDDNLQ